MQGLPDADFSFEELFVPLTNIKAFFIISIVGIVVFFNGLFNYFVRDDGSQIVNNTLLSSISNIGTFFTGSTFYNGLQQNLTGVYYKPILDVYFSIIITLFGPNYFAFHLFQLIIHIANSFIVYLLLKKFIKKPLALVLSLIFLVHPINSETVFYISNSQDILFFFFGSLALLIYSKYDFNPILIAPLLLLSILSKETGILFIFMVLVYVFIYSRKKFYNTLFITTFLTCFYLLLRFSAIGLNVNASVAPIDKLTLFQRILNMPAIFLFYIKTFIFPINLSSSYIWYYTSPSFSTFYLPLFIDLVFLGAISYIGWFIFKKRSSKQFNAYLFFTIWFLIGMLFHLQIVPLDATVAERWFYFPIFGLLGMIGVSLESINFTVKSSWTIFVITVVILILSIRTIIRSSDWRNEFILDSHDIKISENNYILEKGMGLGLLQAGQPKEALPYIINSVNHFPSYTTYDALGDTFKNLLEFNKAKSAYLVSLHYGKYYYTYDELGGLTLVTGNNNENKMFLNEALKMFPTDPNLWLYLAILEYKTGNKNEAKIAIEHAYFYNSNSAQIINTYDIIANNKPMRIKAVVQ